ncbi:hypothetical protein BSNK01_20660 [Bacillaceae bacterium]
MQKGLFPLPQMGVWGKWPIPFISCFLLFLLLFPLQAYADEQTTVYEMIEEQSQGSDEQAERGDGSVADSGEKQSPQGNADRDTFSIFTFFLRLILSLSLTILLIFLLYKLLAARTRKWQANGPFRLLGGCMLGANRSVQAVLIGRTIYILGVGENVQLIRTIEEGEEYDAILQSAEPKRKSESWPEILQGKLQELKKDRETVESWLQEAPGEREDRERR